MNINLKQLYQKNILYFQYCNCLKRCNNSTQEVIIQFTYIITMEEFVHKLLDHYPSLLKRLNLHISSKLDYAVLSVGDNLNYYVFMCSNNADYSLSKCVNRNSVYQIFHYYFFKNLLKFMKH